jgi:hypothetical protein
MTWVEFAIDNLRPYHFGENRVLCSVKPAPSSFEDGFVIDLDTDAVSKSSQDVPGLIFGAISGSLYYFKGPVERVLPLLHEVYFGISTMSISAVEKAQLACQFLVEFSQRRIVGLFDDEESELPVVLPDSVRFLWHLSDSNTCYIPMFLIMGIGMSMYGENLDDLNLLDWSVQRIRHSDLQYFDSILGLEMKVKRGVFVPDRLVGELFVKAALTKNSMLLQDVRGHRVAEPCTGSGYLGILAAKLGAKHVISSDVDQASIETAQENAERAGLQGSIAHVRANGFPEMLQNVSAIIFNPPWIDDIAKEQLLFWAKDNRRCMIDIGHALLYRILRAGAITLPPGSAVWFVLGAKAQGTPIGEKIVFDDISSYMERSCKIVGRRRGMALYRYVKRNFDTPAEIL